MIVYFLILTYHLCKTNHLRYIKYIPNEFFWKFSFHFLNRLIQFLLTSETRKPQAAGAGWLPLPPAGQKPRVSCRTVFPGENRPAFASPLAGSDAVCNKSMQRISDNRIIPFDQRGCQIKVDLFSHFTLIFNWKNGTRKEKWRWFRYTITTFGLFRYFGRP